MTDITAKFANLRLLLVLEFKLKSQHKFDSLRERLAALQLPAL